MLRLKLVALGDAGVGKTALLVTYTTNSFPFDTPSMQENYTANVLVDGCPVSLCLYDSNLQCNYMDTDAIMLCCDVTHHDSLLSIERKWLPELKEYYPNVPIVLVGLKDRNCKMTCETKLCLVRSKMCICSANLTLVAGLVDAHLPSSIVGIISSFFEQKEHFENCGCRVWSDAEGRAMAKKIGACAYVEAGYSNKSSKQPFDEAIRAALVFRNPPTQKKSKCVVQ